MSDPGPVESIALDRHVVLILGDAPELTPQQLDRLSALLRGTQAESQAAA